MRSFFLASLVVFALPAAADAQGFGRQRNEPQLEHFTFQRIEFAAPSLESVWAEAAVYLPAGYDDAANADKRYPWAVWLHGMNGDWRRFHYGGAETLDKLRGKGDVPEMIFVALSAGRRSLYMNGERGGDYEDLVVRDLVRAMQARYRVGADRQHRAVMGCSVGGMGALKIAFKHPTVFGSVAAHSSAIFPADPDDLPERYERQRVFMANSMGLEQTFGDPIDKKRWAQEMPMALLQTLQPADLQGLRIFIDAGTEDRYGFAEPNVALHKALEERGIEHEWHLIEGAGHAWGDGRMEERLARSLRFVAKGFEE